MLPYSKRWDIGSSALATLMLVILSQKEEFKQVCQVMYWISRVRGAGQMLTHQLLKLLLYKMKQRNKMKQTVVSCYGVLISSLSRRHLDVTRDETRDSTTPAPNSTWTTPRLIRIFSMTTKVKNLHSPCFFWTGTILDDSSLKAANELCLWA